MTTNQAAGRSGSILALQAVTAIVVVAAGMVGLLTRSGEPSEAVTAMTALTQRSYIFAMRQEVTGPGAKSPSTFGFTLEGSFDAKSGLGRFTVDLKKLGFDVKCIYVGDEESVYTRVHPSRQAQIGAAWLKTSADAALGAGNFAVTPDKVRNLNEDFLESLQAAGDAEIGGVQTTRYTGEADLRSFFTEDAPQIEMLPAKIPFELYIDAEGLPRRTTTTFQTSTGPKIKVKATMNLISFEDVNIERPTDTKEGDLGAAASACLPADLGAGSLGY